MRTPFAATAFICVYNEADIIGSVIRHLDEQGVGVHVVDNWSTDGSGEITREFPLVGYEKFPEDGPSQYYLWSKMLDRVSALAHASASAWCVHHDADEIRRSSREGESLLDGFARVERVGSNAVNFQVYHFMPTDDGYPGVDPEGYFNYFTVDQMDCRMRQVKAWKNGQRVDLSSTGGHFAAFSGIKVHPEKFVLKHYPLRTAEQARRKVLDERMKRYDPAERAKGWHVQYNGLAVRQDWIKDSAELRPWRGKKTA